MGFMLDLRDDVMIDVPQNTSHRKPLDQHLAERKKQPTETWLRTFYFTERQFSFLWEIPNFTHIALFFTKTFYFLYFITSIFPAVLVHLHIAEKAPSLSSTEKSILSRIQSKFHILSMGLTHFPIKTHVLEHKQSQDLKGTGNIS